MQTSINFSKLDYLHCSECGTLIDDPNINKCFICPDCLNQPWIPTCPADEVDNSYWEDNIQF